MKTLCYFLSLPDLLHVRGRKSEKFIVVAPLKLSRLCFIEKNSICLVWGCMQSNN